MNGEEGRETEKLVEKRRARASGEEKREGLSRDLDAAVDALTDGGRTRHGKAHVFKHLLATQSTTHAKAGNVGTTRKSG